MKLRWCIVGLLFCAIASGAYFFWPRETRASLDPQLLERFETRQKPLVAKLIASDSMLERIQLVGELHKTIVDLTEQQRREIFEYARRNSPELRDAFIAREQKRVDEYFALPPEKQTEALDKHIDEMESMRQMFAGFRGGAPGGPGVGPPAGGRGNSDHRRQLELQRIMNVTTPKFRAQMGEYMLQMNQRREERGLKPASPAP